MPRESKTQTTIRTGGAQSEVVAPSERVISGRLFIQNPYMNVVSDKAKGKLRLADAAKGLQKTVLSVLDKRAQAQEKVDFRDGQEAALTGDSSDVDYFTRTTAGQTKAFTEGMAAATARKNGHKMTNEIAKDLANGDYASEADARGVITSYLEQNLEGMENETYRGVMLDTIEKKEEALLKTWRDEKNVRTLDAVTNDYNAAQRNDFREGAAQGDTVQEMHTTYRTYMDQADMTGITRQAAGEMALQNIEEAAIANGRMDLYGIFEIPNQAAEDPSLTLPGLANSPKFQKKMADSQRRAAKAIKADTATRTNKAEYGMLKAHQELVHAESYQEAYDNVENLYESGVYTDKQAIAERERIKTKMVKEDKTIRGAGLAATGEIGTKGIEEGYTKKEIQAGVDKFSRDQYHGATAETMPQTHGIVIGRAVQNGVMPSFHKEHLNNITPHDATGFAEAVELYKRYEQVNPSFLQNGRVDKQQTMMFHRYEAMVSRNIDPESARMMLQQLAPPEYAESVLKTNKAAWDTKIDEEIVNNVDIPWSLSEGTVHNGRYVHDRIREGASIYISMNPGANAKEALEYSMKEFEANHSLMQTPDRLDEDGDTIKGAYVYAYHAGAELPGDFNETAQWYSDKLTEKWAGHEVNQSDWYTVSPSAYSPESDQWDVRKSDGTPVVVVNKEYGYSYPLTVDRKNLSAVYANEQLRKSKPPVKSRRQLTYEMKNLQIERKAQEARAVDAQNVRDQDVGRQQGRR